MKRDLQGISFPLPSHENSPCKPVKVGDRLYTCAEAAELTNTTERFWRGLIADRRICYEKLGKYVRIPEWSINELLASGTVGPD